MAMRSTSFVFTLNNPENSDLETLQSRLDGITKYYCIGKETGSSGTPHFQGYVRFSRRYYLRQLRDIISPRAHIEVARGTPKQNRSYCTKDGDFVERGELPKGRGEANNRDEIAKRFAIAVRGGRDKVDEFANEFPGSWYFNGHTMLRNAQFLVEPILRPGIHVQWIYGEPGVGKSRRAHEQLPNAYIKEPRTKWWNGYVYQSEVIIDDFGPGGIDINHCLRWFDRYKCMVETKGGMVALHATTFVITSNFEPSDIWKDKDGVVHPQMDALYRRIELIKME